MINARAKAIDSAILFFLQTLSQWSKITAFCSCGFITIIA